jgi:ATP-dependent protease ClpP protease subunit
MKPTRKANFSMQMSGNDAVLYFYDEIGGWGIWAEDIARQIDGRSFDNVTMRFHSDGGDMQEASAITSLLGSAVEERRIGTLHSIVDGRAFSAATWVAMAAPTIDMSPLGLWGIHRPQAIVRGNSEELVSTAKILEGFEDTLVKTYMQRTGADEKTISEWITGDGANDGTVFTPQEAQAAGFINQITEMEVMPTVMEGQFDNKIDAFPQPQMNQFINKVWRCPTTQPVHHQEARAKIAKLRLIQALDL